MAKILFALVVLAVCQYGSANQQDIDQVVDIINTYTPEFVKPLYTRINNVVENIPSAEELDNLVSACEQIIDQISNQFDKSKSVFEQAKEFAKIAATNAAVAATDAAKESFTRSIVSPQGNSIAAAANGIVAEFTQSVEEASEIGKEVIGTANRVYNAGAF